MLIELTSIVRVFNHTKYINQKYMIQPTLINLHPTEYSQELRYYLFGVNLIGVLEVAMLLMTYLIECVFLMKQKI